VTRIALISDQHFDVSSRWQEHLRIMGWIAEDLRARSVDLIALGGDLFEKRPCPIETSAAARWIMELAEIAPVIGVYGNHDVAHSLDVMSQLRTRHPVVIADRPMVHFACEGRLAVACLPWPRRAQIIAHLNGVGGSELINEVATDALRAVIRGLSVEMDAHAPAERVFLGHVQMRSAVVSTGQPLAPGADFELGLDDLGLLRADAYLLGHIHRGNAGEWSIGDAPVIYPGSPRRNTYGEIEAKAYVIVEVGDGPARTEVIETPATPMVHLTATLRDILAQEDGSTLRDLEIVDAPYPDVRGAEVRFRYSIPSDEREIGKARAVAWRDSLIGEGAVDVKVEEVVIPVVRARAPEVAAALTLDDKLAALWKSRGDVPERADALLAKTRLIEEEHAHAL
jgi:DNA repair exonuclease SbcCD nuclease subunit